MQFELLSKGSIHTQLHTQRNDASRTKSVIFKEALKMHFNPQPFTVTVTDILYVCV